MSTQLRQSASRAAVVLLAIVAASTATRPRDGVSQEPVDPVEVPSPAPLPLTPAEAAQMRMQSGSGAAMAAGGDALRQAALGDDPWLGWTCLVSPEPGSTERWVNVPGEYQGMANPRCLAVSPPDAWIPPVVWSIDERARAETGAIFAPPRYTKGLAIDWDGDGMRELLLFGEYRSSAAESDTNAAFFTLVDYAVDPAAPPGLRHYQIMDSGGYEQWAPMAGEVRWQDVDADAQADVVFRVHSGGYEDSRSGWSALVDLDTTPHWLVLGWTGAFGEGAEFQAASPEVWMTALESGTTYFVATLEFPDYDGGHRTGFDFGLFVGGPHHWLMEEPLAELGAAVVAQSDIQAGPWHPLIRPTERVEEPPPLVTAILARGDWRDLAPLYDLLLPHTLSDVAPNGVRVPGDEQLRLLGLGVYDCALPETPTLARAAPTEGFYGHYFAQEDAVAPAEVYFETVLVLGLGTDAAALEAAARDLIGTLPVRGDRYDLRPDVVPLLSLQRDEDAPPVVCPDLAARMTWPAPVGGN